jgi:hypothetical protein
VQVGPIKPTVKAPVTKRLKLMCDDPLSYIAFKFDLRRYSEVAERLTPQAALVGAGAAHAVLHSAMGRGSHSPTFRLNVSAFCGKGGALGGCLGGVQGVSGVIRAWLGCVLYQKRLRLS